MKKVDKAILGAVHVSERLVAPLLSTTCFGYQRANAKMNIGGTVDALAAAAVSGTEADTAFIRLDATPADVAKAMACRCLVIERLSCPTPDENVARRTFDVFSNPNTELIVDALGERHWLLFGAGFEHCLLAAAEGLRARNHRVTILEDAVIHGGRSTPQTSGRRSIA